MNNYSYVNINILYWCEKVKRECGFLEMFFAAFLFLKKRIFKNRSGFCAPVLLVDCRELCYNSFKYFV